MISVIDILSSKTSKIKKMVGFEFDLNTNGNLIKYAKKVCKAARY